MRRRTRISILAILAVIATGFLAFGLTDASFLTLGGLAINKVRSANNPPGTLTTEENKNFPPTLPVAYKPASTDEAPADNAGDWPSYNRTLESRRYSPLSQINTKNVNGLRAICVYDTGLHESFESGPLVVRGTLIFTTARDVISIDPDSCKEIWRAHDDYKITTPLITNRGTAYLDGRLFRGTLDGRVIAYDFDTGKQLWSTTIASPTTGEQLDAAPIAWNGLVYIGTALGDVKGVKGRMYALDAESGRVVWEDYLVPRSSDDHVRGPSGALPPVEDTWGNRHSAGLPISGGGTWTSYTLDRASGRLYVPVGNPSPDFVNGVRTGTNLYTNTILTLDAKTGNYISHYQIAPSDWHDWDVSNTPTIVTTRAGKKLMAFSPKDGHLYGYDMFSNRLLYKKPVTRIENADVQLTTSKETHFCPGAVGGGEWNGVAYDPSTNLLLTGDDEWCTAVKLQTVKDVKAQKDGSYWTGAQTNNPLEVMGTQDPHSDWAGWLYATDADNGQWRWRVKTNYPILGGLTPTGGGIVFFGDMGGNFYALDAKNGQRLWHQKLAGAIGGGVITYMAKGGQRVAVAAGLTSPLWPTEINTAKIIVFGLDGGVTQ